MELDELSTMAQERQMDTGRKSPFQGGNTMTRGRPVKRRKRGNHEGSIYVANRNGIKYWVFQ